MREEIKQRIEQIRRGEVPEGYKRTKAGVIPNEWDLCTISDCLEKVDNPVSVEPDTLYTQIGIRSHGKGLFYKDPITGKELGNKSVFWIEPNCFVLNIVFAWEQAFGKTTNNEVGMIASHRFPMYRPINNSVDLDYLICYFLTKRGTDILDAASPGGAGRNRTLGQDRFVKSKIMLPPLDEQKKIAEILSAQDKLIALKEKFIEEKKRQKKALMQQLLTGKKRLPGFDKEWNSVPFKDCIFEVDNRSTEVNQHPILSVTKDGIVYQADHFSKQIASDNNIGYKIIKRNQLAFSILNLWMGSVDVLTLCDVGIVSPAYKVFECSGKNLIPSFAKHFLRSYNVVWLYNINSETGASVVRKNLDLTALLNEKLELPPTEEQEAIAEILSTADKELELLQKDLDQEKQKKKSLMQLLLTGIVRV